MTNPSPLHNQTRLLSKKSPGLLPLPSHPDREAFVVGMAKEADLFLDTSALEKKSFLSRASHELQKLAAEQGVSTSLPEVQEVFEKISQMTEPEELIHLVEKYGEAFRLEFAVEIEKEGYDAAFVEGMAKRAQEEMMEKEAAGALRALGTVFSGLGRGDFRKSLGQWWAAGMKPPRAGAAAVGERALAHENLRLHTGKQPDLPAVIGKGDGYATAHAARMPGLRGLAPDSQFVASTNPYLMMRENAYLRRSHTGTDSVAQLTKADNVGMEMLGAGQQAERAGIGAEFRNWAIGQRRRKLGTGIHDDPVYLEGLESWRKRLDANEGQLHYGINGNTGLSAQIDDLRTKARTHDTAGSHQILNDLGANAQMQPLTPGMQPLGSPVVPANAKAYMQGVRGAAPRPVQGFLGGLGASVPGSIIGTTAGGLVAGPLGAFAGNLVGGGAGWAAGSRLASRYGLLKPALVGSGLAAASGVGAGLYGVGKVFGQDSTTDASGMPNDRNRALPFVRNKWAGAAGGALLASMIAREAGLNAGALSWLIPLLGGAAGYSILPKLMNKWRDPLGYGENAIAPQNTYLQNQRFEQAQQSQQ